MIGQIYLVLNLINGKCYVGQTVRSTEVRWKEHCKCASKGFDYPLYYAIRKYGVESFKVEVIYECNSQDELNDNEIRLIQYYKSLTSQNGYNISLGGSGVRGRNIWNHSENSKRLISIGNSGKIRSAETKKKIKQAVLKTFNNDQMRLKISERTKEALSREGVREKIDRNNYQKRRKVVQQFTLKDEFVAEYESATVASMTSGVNKGNLCACCRGKFEQAGGFKWKYVTIPNDQHENY